MTNYPCKIGTGILAGSRRHLGENPAGIPARFWPPGFFFPTGISPGSEIPGAPGSCFETRQDSCREAKILAAKISPGSCCESCQDSRREAQIPVAKISARSCCEAHQDSHRETIIPAAKISPESYCESRQDSCREANFTVAKSWRNLAVNLTKIGDWKRNSW